jgi:hypothetical protein
MMKYDNAGAKTALEAGDNQAGQTYLYRIDGTDAVCLNPGIPYLNLLNTTKATTATQGIALLDKYWIYGFIPTSGTDTDEEIDITAGKAICEDGSTIVETTAVTDLNLATELGGALGNDTTYHVYRYQRAADQAWHIDTSLTPTIGDLASALAYRLIISYKTDGSGDLIAHTGHNRGDKGVLIKYNTRIQDVSTTTSSYVTKTFTVPNGIEKFPWFYFDQPSDSSGGQLFAKPNTIEMVVQDVQSSASSDKNPMHIMYIPLTSDQMDMKETDNQPIDGFTYGYLLFRTQY